MKGTLAISFCLFGYAFGSVSFPDGRLTTTPETQSIREYDDAVILCFDNEGGTVHWQRPKGKSLPEQAKQIGGRLYINNMRFEDAGPYVCLSEDKKHRAKAFIKVLRTATVPDTTSTPRSLSTAGLPSTASPFRWTTPAANTPYPCMYGICNGTCCESNSADSFFDCADGQKISKTLVCNRVNDCKDGSDESKCEPWPSKITVLPKHRVEVYCGDYDYASEETLILECQAVGHPPPLIRWKKYDGHVPSKCQQFSKGGHGVLTCPNFQQSDQGAYSCVAENSVKSAESQPKSIAKCKNTINCRGFKVINEEQIEHCLECYCSGKTTQCQSIKSTATAIKIPFPQSETEIFAKEDGEILFVPTNTSSSPDSKIRDSSLEITYCSLTESDLPETSFLKSFGRHVIFPRHKGKTDFLVKAPDLIIRGNGLSLMYTASLISSPGGNIMDVAASFWPGNWHHLNKKTATRQDLMKVLSNMDTLLIRCEYEQGKTLRLNETATIIIESSTITDWRGSISYVEKCSCPAGYDGLSCETCAPGYKQKSQGDSFICEKIYVPPPTCKEGYTGANCSVCDTAKGYYKDGEACLKAVCHAEGAVSVFLNSFKKCTCKERVTGEFCDRCENGSFYLHKARGCLQCWCSGVTNDCSSSKLYRTIISNTPRGGYNSSDGRNFWLLPSDFSGNRLTSYGGSLHYSMKYQSGIQKEKTYLTVEFLSMADVTLIYTHSTVDTSREKDEKSWSVPLTEVQWKKSDRSTVTRGEFLTVLKNVKAIYIESPYHLSSGLANLTSATMSSASSSSDGDNVFALEVEQCNCPKGYTGLSCESCSEGYYKKRNGTITQCIKCNCSYCDPDFGCPDCPQLTYRDNPEDEKMPVCKPCPCNSNGVSCVKDDYNQIFCRCKPGFTGMHCENAPPEKRDDLTISISPRRIRGKKAGTTISFNCTLIGSEEMTVYLIKRFRAGTNNHTQDRLSRGSRISEKFDVVLDPGLQSVECLAYDADGQMAAHVVGLVEGLITDIKPVKITNCYSEVLNVKESESKDIICEATGSPPPTVTWYKTVNGSAAEKVDTSDGVHTIDSASLYDNGTVYTCVAENSEGDKATCTSVLIVQKKCEVINISPKEVRMTEGESVSIHCTTTAKSPVTWHQYDDFFRREKPIASPRIQVEAGLLRISNASVSDSGAYICTANGENGKINQTVDVTVTEKRVPPTVTIQEYDKTIKEGESTQIHCLVTGKPTPTVTWNKLNDSPGDNVDTVGKVLNINKAVVGNSGIYVCEARSASGNASGYISITVEQVTVRPRVNISEEHIEAHAGEVATVSCLSIGYPRPELTWYAKGIDFINSTRESDNMILIEPQESIKEEKKFIVTNEMDGLIISCHSSNSAGSDSKFTTIKVLQSKSGINETVELVPIGSFYEIMCDFPGELEWEKIGSRMVGDECPILKVLMIKSVQIQHNGTYECRDKSGSRKIINLIVTGFVPKFSKSYLVLPVQMNRNSDIHIELTFNSAQENGVLLREESGKLNIYLERRKIHVSIISTDGDLFDIVMNEEIELRRWYSVTVSIRNRLVEITIYDEKASVHGRKSEQSKDFNIDLGFGNETFFVGGPTPRVRHDLRKRFLHHQHFDGCISQLSINRHEFDLVKEGSHSHNVSLCRKCSEAVNPCGDRGKCLDAPTQYGFICVCPNSPRNKSGTCPASCKGKHCITQLNLCTLLNPCRDSLLHKCRHNLNSLQCECAYGYSGTTCERAQEHSFCAKGNGYVRLPSMLLERHLGKPEIIRMSFTLQKPNGQLLWQGDKGNHLSIAVHEGKLRYVYLNQYSKLEIRTGKELELNKKHLLKLERLNSTASLELDWKLESSSIPEVYKNITPAYYTNRVIGDIYLGNIPNNTHFTGHHVGLTGCIHYISFGDYPKINLPEKEVERANVYPLQKLSSDSNSDESLDYNEGDSDSNELSA